MFTVNLDGQDFEFNGAKNISEVIEFAKNGMGQDKLISDIKLSGRDLSGMEYRLPLRAHKDAVLEIRTQTKSEFIRDKIHLAELSLDVIIARLNMVSPSFAEKGSLEASKHLSGAVNDFQFFLGWLSEVFEMDTQRFAILKADLNGLVHSLKPVLQEIISFQTAGDWEAVGTAIDSKVVPLLEGLVEAVKSTGVLRKMRSV